MLGPHVEQHEVARKYRLRRGLAGRVVRPGAIGIHRHDRRLVGHEAARIQGSRDSLLHVVFADRLVGEEGVADQREALADGGMNAAPGFEV